MKVGSIFSNIDDNAARTVFERLFLNVNTPVQYQQALGKRRKEKGDMVQLTTTN